MTTLKNPYRGLALAPALALVVLTGCNAGLTSRAPVQGRVTFDGQPVDNGAIAFLPLGNGQDAQFRAGAPIVDGKYNVTADRGPSPGKYRVEIYWNKKTGKKISNDPPNTIDETKQVLPARYNTKSDLTVDVQPGRNTLDFNLTKK